MVNRGWDRARTATRLASEYSAHNTDQMNRILSKKSEQTEKTGHEQETANQTQLARVRLWDPAKSQNNAAR